MTDKPMTDAEALDAMDRAVALLRQHGAIASTINLKEARQTVAIRLAQQPARGGECPSCGGSGEEEADCTKCGGRKPIEGPPCDLCGGVQPAAEGRGEVVGEAGRMPGTDGFTTAVFKASDVPVGTKLYAATPPRADTQRQEPTT